MQAGEGWDVMAAEAVDDAGQMIYSKKFFKRVAGGGGGAYLFATVGQIQRAGRWQKKVGA